MSPDRFHGRAGDTDALGDHAHRLSRFTLGPSEPGAPEPGRGIDAEPSAAGPFERVSTPSDDLGPEPDAFVLPDLWDRLGRLNEACDVVSVTTAAGGVRAWTVVVLLRSDPAQRVRVHGRRLGEALSAAVIAAHSHGWISER